MKARNKIIFDRIVGIPIAVVLDCLAWTMGQIVHRNHSDNPAKVKVVVIAKLMGLGSIIRATPMIRVLKKHYPKAKLIFVSTLKNKDLVERLNYLDKHFYIRDNDIWTIFIDTVKLLVKLWKYKVDLYFDLEVHSSLSSVLALLSLARNRYGFYRKTVKFRNGLNTHLIFFNMFKNTIEIYLKLASACGAQGKDQKLEKPNLTGEDYICFQNWLKQHNIIKKSYIAINPNASDLMLERRWPASYFVELINAISPVWQKPIILLGGPNEKQYTHKIYQKLSPQTKENVFNATGEMPLGAVMALIQEARLLITNDSGLYHIGISFNVPIVSLWGPVSPNHYGDLKIRNNHFIYRNIYCSPCLYHTDFPPCRGNNICMKMIFPEEVYKMVAKVLGFKRKKPIFSSPSHLVSNSKQNDIGIIRRLYWSIKK